VTFRRRRPQRADGRYLVGGELLDSPPFAGAVVIARCVLHGPDGAVVGAKPRPVVLYERDRCGWAGWRLTSKAVTAGGRTNHRVPGMWLLQMAPSYLNIGHRHLPLAVVPDDDVLGVVWAAPVQMLQALAQLTPSVPAGWAELVNAEHVTVGWWWPRSTARHA
jgi:hypothetical protein